jgi:hypothetical protein
MSLCLFCARTPSTPTNSTNVRAVFSALSVWVWGVLVVGVEVGLALITQRSEVQILPPQFRALVAALFIVFLT